MIERRNSLRFPLKAFAEFLLREFHRDDAVEACVAGFPYLAHPSVPEQREHLEVTDLVAGREWHTPESIQFSRSKSG